MWSRRLTSAVSFACADVRELEEEEEEELDCSTPEVVNKYQFAGNVANGTCVSRAQCTGCVAVIAREIFAQQPVRIARSCPHSLRQEC